MAEHYTLCLCVRELVLKVGLMFRKTKLDGWIGVMWECFCLKWGHLALVTKESVLETERYHRECVRVCVLVTET